MNRLSKSLLCDLCLYYVQSTFWKCIRLADIKVSGFSSFVNVTVVNMFIQYHVHSWMWKYFLFYLQHYQSSQRAIQVTTQILPQKLTVLQPPSA